MSQTSGTTLIRETAQAAFWQNFEAFPDVMQNLAFRVTSTSDQETYPWLDAAPSVREMKGGRIPKSVAEREWTIKNKMWENTVEVGYPLVKYGKLGAIAALVGNLGAKARANVFKQISTLMSTGDATTCYDGQYFFDSDHADSGAPYTTSQDNDLTSNITTTTAPTDTEWATAVRGAIDTLYSFKDSEGDPVMPTPDTEIIVMVPPGYRAVSKRIEKVDTIAGSVGNDLKGEYRTVVNPWLDAPATTAEFFVFNAGGARKPFIWQVADDVYLEDDMGGDNEFHTKAVNFGSFGYYNVDYGDWRYAIRHIFT